MPTITTLGAKNYLVIHSVINEHFSEFFSLSF